MFGLKEIYRGNNNLGFVGMKGPRVTNSRAREYVEAKKTFKGNNTAGIWQDDVYVVYSYDYHWPLFVWDGKQWWINEEKYSASTSRQKILLFPTADTWDGEKHNYQASHTRELKQKFNV